MAQLTGGELGQADLENARLGLFHTLCERFSPQFADLYGAELLAQAHSELAEALAKGIEVRHPSGWLINCGVQRAKNLLRDKGRHPDLVELKVAEALANELDTPEEIAVSQDRTERVQEAIDKLAVEQQMVLELRYFEGMSLREAARVLGWETTKVKRLHRAALERLQALLRVESVEDLAIEIGLASWVSLAGVQSRGTHLPAGMEALSHRATHTAIGLWGRLQELARRLLLGGASEPASTAAASGVARTAGVCGAAALACLATGVVGPGVGGVDLAGSHHSPAPKAARSAPAPVPTLAPSPSSAASNPSAKASSGRSKQTSGRHSTQSSGLEGQGAGAFRASGRQVEEEFSPFATGRGGGSSSTSAASRTPGPPSGGGSSASSKQVSEEFGAFR